MGYELKDIKQVLDTPEEEMDELITKTARSLEEERKKLESKIKFNYLLSIVGTRFLTMKSFISHDITKLMKMSDTKFKESPYYEELMRNRENVTQETMDTLMSFFEKFAAQYAKGLDFRDKEPQETAEKCYAYILEHFLKVSLDDFSVMVCFIGGGGLITSFLNHYYGKYTAEFAMGSFLIFCKNNGIDIGDEEEEMHHES